MKSERTRSPGRLRSLRILRSRKKRSPRALLLKRIRTARFQTSLSYLSFLMLSCERRAKMSLFLMRILARLELLLSLSQW